MDKTFKDIKVVTTGEEGGARPFETFNFLEDHLKKMHPEGDYDVKKMAFIGDRLYEDVYYANINNMASIYVTERFDKGSKEVKTDLASQLDDIFL